MTPSEEAIFRAHLEARLVAVPKCPLCATDKWVPTGPVSMFGEQMPGPTGLTQSALPVVLLVCANCFYLVPFGWRAIEKASSKPEGGRGVGG